MTMKLAMVSHVPPVPSTAGQRQRVRHTMEALRSRFELTFVTSQANLDQHPDLVDHADHVVAIASGQESSVDRARRIAAGAAYAAYTGLKRSNHDIDHLFSASAIASALDPGEFDLAFFHYWHAQQAVECFSAAGVPCVLDMHDILSRARGSQLRAIKGVPEFWAARQERRYRAAEEKAWGRFDGIIAINEEERDIAQDFVADDVSVWYAPMGVHLDRWPYAHDPAPVPRLAYYGGLSSPAREAAVVQCVEQIMPMVWERHPTCELYVVGANPTSRIERLGDDARVHVTGFVDDPSEVLASAWALLCPFSGRFGFRSRLIEVMACGVPVVANPDAAHGMGLLDDDALLFGDDDAELAERCVAVLDDRDDALRRGRLARSQAERFDFDSTYGTLARELADFANPA